MNNNTIRSTVPPWRRKKILATVSALGASAVCATMLFVGSPFASAATTTLLTCTGQGGANASSPVTNTAQTDTITPTDSKTTSCVDLTGNAVKVTAGKIAASDPANKGTVTASCLSESNPSGSVNVIWTLSNGKTATSTVTATRISGDDEADTVTAKVSSGMFAGANVTVDGVNTTLADLTKCEGAGFTSGSGTGTVVLSQ